MQHPQLAFVLGSNMYNVAAMPNASSPVSSDMMMHTNSTPSPSDSDETPPTSPMTAVC